MGLTADDLAAITQLYAQYAHAVDSGDGPARAWPEPAGILGASAACDPRRAARRLSSTPSGRWRGTEEDR